MYVHVKFPNGKENVNNILYVVEVHGLPRKMLRTSHEKVRGQALAEWSRGETKP